MLRPIYLQPGDKVALISPSGIATKEQLDAACSLLTSWELEPVPGQHVLSRHGRLAGTDEERLHDLQTALDAEDIRGHLVHGGRLRYVTYRAGSRLLHIPRKPQMGDRYE